MGFLTPVALFFGLTLPVIVLLWLLKRRRQEQEISSTYLWHQVLRDVRANAPWQRLVAHLLLILQLIAAALFALALARPHLTGPGLGRTHLILLLDGSGSMRIADGEATRFEKAKAEALNQLQPLRSRDRVTLVSAGRIPRVLASLAEPDRARAALADAQPTHESADWVQALSLASSAGRDQPGARIAIISDGVVPPATLERLGLPATAIQVGGEAENLSIRLSVRPGSGSRNPAALGRIANHGRQQASAIVELQADDTVVDERRVEVPPGGTAEVTWQDLPAGATVFRARITGADALAADNADYAVIQRTGRVKALLVSKANLFLDQALRLRDDLELTRSTPENYAPGPYQLYIFDGWLPAELPEGALFLVAPPAANPLVPLGSQVPITGLRPASAANAVTAYVPLEDVHIARGRPLELPTWANPLLEAPEGVLVAAGHLEGRAVAVFGFDLHESDFPLRLGFPVLMQNLLAWLVPPAPTAARVSSGEPVPIALDPLAKGATVAAPDGRTITIAPPLPAPPFSETSLPGLYQVTQALNEGERTSHFLVEFPPSESQSDGNIALAASPLSGPGSARPPLQEVWPFVAALALAILGLEWWVFIRGA